MSTGRVASSSPSENPREDQGLGGEPGKGRGADDLG